MLCIPSVGDLIVVKSCGPYGPDQKLIEGSYGIVVCIHSVEPASKPDVRLTYLEILMSDSDVIMIPAEDVEVI